MEEEVGLRGQNSGKVEEVLKPKELAQDESLGANKEFKEERKEFEERPINPPEDYKKRDEYHEELKERADSPKVPVKNLDYRSTML